MDIYLNIDKLLNLIATNIDTNGDLSVFDFYEAVFRMISRNTGGIISLGLEYDESVNTYYVREQSTLTTRARRLDLYDAPLTSPSVIQVGRVKPNSGSFVKNMGIQSNITPNMATQITIGAQAGGKSVGANSAMFSAWNKGLTDRIFPTKVTPTGENTTTFTDAQVMFETDDTSFQSSDLRIISLQIRYMAWAGWFKGY